MKLTLKALTLAVSLVTTAANPSHAEQQVTLKSGVALVGEATFDGDSIVVRIADAEHRVSLADVASIAPLHVGQNEQARRLLLAALEARVLGGAPREALALLEEATRLAPDDPQIAFWHASTLLDAGSGNAAKRVMESHRAAMEKEFPGRLEKLAKRINARMILELLPEELVARLDALNSSGAPGADPEQVAGFAAFRVVDQLGAPVPRSAVQLQGNLNKSAIEDFPGGYFLATFTRSRNSMDEPIQLQISEYGVAPTSQVLRIGSGQRFPASEFVVRRYVEDDKQVFRGSVVDADGNAIPGARVIFQAASNSRGPEQSRVGVTGEDGRVEFRVYPGTYSIRVSAAEYGQVAQQVEMPAEGPSREMRIALHKAIAANIRIKWSGKALQGVPGAPGAVPGGDSVTGETTLVVNGAQPEPGNNQEVMWLRPRQVQDRLTLQINLMMYGGVRAVDGAAPWIKKWTPDDQAGEKDDVEQRMTAARKKFDAIDLKETDELAEDFKPFNAGGQPGIGPAAMNAQVKFGEIFVGRLISRDVRTGRPVDMTFKAIIEPRKDEAADP